MLGRSSLLLYVAHVALIALVLDEWFEGRTLPGFLLLYALMALGLWALAWAKQRLRIAPGGRLEWGHVRALAPRR